MDGRRPVCAPRSTFHALRFYWPELVSVLAPLLVFWRLVIGGQVLYWGLPALQFVPWRGLVNDALRHGHLPLWTPLLGMGAPLMANHQSAVFYPPNLLSLILSPEVAISLLAVLHLSFAGAGMVRLARRIGLGDFGSAVAGLSFGLSGYLTGRLWFVTINNAMAWLPWIVLASTPPRAREGVGGEGERLTFRNFLTLSALLALQLLAGHAQSSFYTLLLAGAWVVWHSLFPSSNRERGNYQSLITDLFCFALAFLFALCLTAIQLIPTFELLRESPRATAADYDFAMTYSLWPWRLFTFVIPNFFGHPADHDYWGYAAYWEDNAYIGLLPPAFAVYGLTLCAASRRDRREHGEGESKNSVFSVRSLVMFSLLTAAVSIVLALGRNTPIFAFFYRYIPGFGLFQAPSRMLIWYTFAVSLLAGVGAHHWRATERKRYWARLGIAGSLAVFALGIAGMFLIANPRAVTFSSGLTWAAAFAVGMFVIILIQPESANRWRWLALAFVALDLGLAAVRLNPTGDAALYHLRSHFTLAPERGRIFQYAEDEYRVKFREFFSFKSFDALDAQALRDSLLPNLFALDGMASANNFDPLLPARYAKYVEAMETNPQLMNLADVRALVKPMGIVSVRSEPASRLRIVYNARTVDNGDAALAAITSPAFDPDAEAIIEHVSSTPNLPVLVLDPNRFSATVTLERDGYVLLSDTYYPGWRASVDGNPQPILRADYNFRAVAVPAGTHTVIFEYAPFSVTLGLIITAIALILWMALLIRNTRYAMRL